MPLASRREVRAAERAAYTVRPLWLLVAVYTAARLDELERMQWEHIDFRQDLVRLRGNKTTQLARNDATGAKRRSWRNGAAAKRQSPRCSAS